MAISAAQPSLQPVSSTARFLIVDGHAYAYRAFYAIRQLSSPSGAPTNAIYGFIKMLAKMRVSHQPTHWAVVWDQQTVVLGGLISENVNKIKDKVPVLGDLPLVGRFFRSESSSTAKKNLVIFVTPTIIDPAGNPVHTPENLPFDPHLAPPQTPVK